MRQVAATGRCDKSLRVYCLQVAATRCLFGAQTANLEEWECELVFHLQYGENT